MSMDECVCNEIYFLLKNSYSARKSFFAPKVLYFFFGRCGCIMIKDDYHVWDGGVHCVYPRGGVKERQTTLPRCMTSGSTYRVSILLPSFASALSLSWSTTTRTKWTVDKPPAATTSPTHTKTASEISPLRRPLRIRAIRRSRPWLPSSSFRTSDEGPSLTLRYMR